MSKKQKFLEQIETYSGKVPSDLLEAIRNGFDTLVECDDEKAIEESEDLVDEVTDVAAETLAGAVSDVVEDKEGLSVRANLLKISEKADKLAGILSDDQQLKSWVQEKIAIAAQTMDDVSDYMEKQAEPAEVPEILTREPMLEEDTAGEPREAMLEKVYKKLTQMLLQDVISRPELEKYVQTVYPELSKRFRWHDAPKPADSSRNEGDLQFESEEDVIDTLVEGFIQHAKLEKQLTEVAE